MFSKHNTISFLCWDYKKKSEFSKICHNNMPIEGSCRSNTVSDATVIKFRDDSVFQFRLWRSQYFTISRNFLSWNPTRWDVFLLYFYNIYNIKKSMFEEKGNIFYLEYYIFPLTWLELLVQMFDLSTWVFWDAFKN